MKIIYILFPFALLSLITISCDSHQAEYEEEVLRQKLLQDSVASLEEEERLIKGEYAETMETITAINEALLEIGKRNKEMAALMLRKDLEEGDMQASIIAQIDALKKANSNTYGQAKRLQNKAKAYKVENQQIKTMIESLEVKFAAKEKELDSLQVDISKLKTSLNELQQEVDSTDSELANTYAELKVQSAFLAEQNKKLETTIADLEEKNKFIEDDATAFIVCGNRRELRQNKIITLLSMKRLTPIYNSQVRELGTQFSIYDRDKIGCGEGDIIYLLPERDPNSYLIEGSNVKILDRKTFWNTSKSLVLIKK
jgi:chromosome segregation ATPase